MHLLHLHPAVAWAALYGSQSLSWGWAYLAPCKALHGALVHACGVLERGHYALACFRPGRLPLVLLAAT